MDYRFMDEFGSERNRFLPKYTNHQIAMANASSIVYDIVEELSKREINIKSLKKQTNYLMEIFPPNIDTIDRLVDYHFLSLEFKNLVPVRELIKKKNSQAIFNGVVSFVLYVNQNNINNTVLKSYKGLLFELFNYYDNITKKELKLKETIN